MIERLKSAVSATRARLEIRHSVRTLQRLDDCHLRDLGIHRADIERAVRGIEPRL